MLENVLRAAPRFSASFLLAGLERCSFKFMRRILRQSYRLSLETILSRQSGFRMHFLSPLGSFIFGGCWTFFFFCCKFSGKAVRHVPSSLQGLRSLNSTHIHMNDLAEIGNEFLSDGQCSASDSNYPFILRITIAERLLSHPVFAFVYIAKTSWIEFRVLIKSVTDCCSLVLDVSYYILHLFTNKSWRDGINYGRALATSSRA